MQSHIRGCGQRIVGRWIIDLKSHSAHRQALRRRKSLRTRQLTSALLLIAAQSRYILLNSTENRDFQRVVVTMTTGKLPEFSAVRVVVFDLGFTLWNEERVWNDWASRLRVPPLEFFAILGSIIERAVCPGFDLSRERQRGLSSGESDSFRPDELYPVCDSVPYGIASGW